MPGAAVRQIVAVHRSDDRVREIQMTHSLCDVAGLVGVERPRRAFTNRAEPAMARADIPAEHKGSSPVSPAFEDVRAPRFLTNRVQVQTLNQLQQMILVGRIAQTNAQPFGLRLAGLGV